MPRTVATPFVSPEPITAARSGTQDIPLPTARPPHASGPAFAAHGNAALHTYGAPEPQPVSTLRPMASVAPPPVTPPERALLPVEPSAPPSSMEALAFDRERLTEALVDILQDAARREGLEV